LMRKRKNVNGDWIGDKINLDFRDILLWKMTGVILLDCELIYLSFFVFLYA
jgi:predicted membrane-bound dolichyl-phosphate-mannose-protein mannosyltransferase